jgi:hypothetical protein
MEPPKRLKIHPAFHEAMATRHVSLDYRPPLFLRLLKAGLFVFVGLAVIVIIYVGIWMMMASTMRETAVDWAAARRAEGYVVQYSELTAGGFPFHLRLTTQTPGMGQAGEEDPWAWEGREAVIEARPWKPSALTIKLFGDHRLALRVADEGVTYRGKSEDITLDLTYSGGQPTAGRLRVKGLDLSSGDTARDVAIGSADITISRRSSDETLGLWVNVKGLKAPAALSLPLGNNLSRMFLQARVRGALSPPLDHDTLLAWRDGGGKVDVERLDGTYGPLGINATGTLALDGDMQPAGSMTAKIQGFFDTIDLLRRQRFVRSRDAVMAKLVLGVLAKRPKGGGPLTLSLPLTLQKRVLFAGPAALATFDPVEWKKRQPLEAPAGESKPPAKASGK